MPDHRSNKKNNIFSKESLVPLAVGTVLAFIAGKLLNPLLSYLYSLLLNLGGKVIEYISDTTYIQISDGFSEQSSMFSFYLLCFIFWIGITICMSTLKDRYTALFERYDEYEAALNTIHEPEQCSQQAQLDFTPDNIMQDELCKREHDIRISIITERKKFKLRYAAGIFLLVLLYIILLYSYARNSYVNKKITVLTNNIEIVSPYISDSEYKQLKSAFHSMKSSNDYDDLISHLSKISNDYSLTLKE